MPSHEMALRELLLRRKDAVWQRWYERVLSSYPAKTAAFLGQEPDPFQNPVGHTIARGTRRVVEALVAGADVDDLGPDLEPMIKIRSLQVSRPSEAVSFVGELGDVIREELARDLGDSALRSELDDLEDRLARLTLLAFDIYVGCRDKLHEVRLNELKHSVSTLLRRASDPELGSGTRARSRSGTSED